VHDAAAAARDLWNRVIVLAADLGPEDWSRPTPCADWDVHDLLAHLSGVQTLFDGGPQPPVPSGSKPDPGANPVDAWTAAGVAARREWAPEEVMEELHAARDGHVAHLEAVPDWTAPRQGPTGPTDEEGLLRVRLFDIWVHLQDLRLALDLPVEAGDASPAARIAHEYVWDRVPWMFVKKAGAGEGATMRVRLAEPLDADDVVEVRDGRGRWNPAADPGGCVVEGDPAALTLLACGRGDPDDWRARGLLAWEGRTAATFVDRGRMFG
jgi:uncharacterized protein (TIGR03083 family)